MNELKSFRYQVLPEDFYDIIKRRKLKLDEAFFAVYLRGKYIRFGNPFTCCEAYITKEIGISHKIISKLRMRLQLKGVIKYDSFHGYKQHTQYVMLDSYMTPPRKEKSKGAWKGLTRGLQRPKDTVPNGIVYTVPNGKKILSQMGHLSINDIEERKIKSINDSKTHTFSHEKGNECINAINTVGKVFNKDRDRLKYDKHPG